MIQGFLDYPLYRKCSVLFHRYFQQVKALKKHS